MTFAGVPETYSQYTSTFERMLQTFKIRGAERLKNDMELTHYSITNYGKV